MTNQKIFTCLSLLILCWHKFTGWVATYQKQKENWIESWFSWSV